MISYIALLRAINVGGHTVKMDYLRQLFTEVGCQNVRTYIQTGNVFFDSAEIDRTTLRTIIQEHLKKALGYEVAVMLRTPQELQRALAQKPFQEEVLTDDVRFCIAFISAPLPESVTVPYTSPKGDFKIVALTPGEVCMVSYLQNGKPGNPNLSLEKIFKVQATTRFFHTAEKILQAALAQ